MFNFNTPKLYFPASLMSSLLVEKLSDPRLKLSQQDQLPSKLVPQRNTRFYIIRLLLFNFLLNFLNQNARSLRVDSIWQFQRYQERENRKSQAVNIIVSQLHSSLTFSVLFGYLSTFCNFQFSFSLLVQFFIVILKISYFFSTRGIIKIKKICTDVENNSYKRTLQKKSRNSSFAFRELVVFLSYLSTTY